MSWVTSRHWATIHWCTWRIPLQHSWPSNGTRNGFHQKLGYFHHNILASDAACVGFHQNSGCLPLEHVLGSITEQAVIHWCSCWNSSKHRCLSLVHLSISIVGCFPFVHVLGFIATQVTFHWCRYWILSQHTVHLLLVHVLVCITKQAAFS
jgi:hypothetical protein